MAKKEKCHTGRSGAAARNVWTYCQGPNIQAIEKLQLLL
jgi:hypothetical protein